MSRLVAQLHIARAKLGLTVEDYRAVLIARTGKSSAKDMTERERAEALEGFKALGFVPVPTPSRSLNRKPHVRLIYALWGDLQKRGAVTKGARGAPALRAWVARQTGVATPEFLTVQQGQSCAEALKQWIKRIEEKGKGDVEAR